MQVINMIHILLNQFTFDQAWGFDELSQLIEKGMKVLMMPLSYNDGWSNEFVTWDDLFTKGKPAYEMMVRPFYNYGIREKQISWFNYYQDNYATAKAKIEAADIIVITGDCGEWIMQRIEDLGLRDLLCNFDGILIGHHAGALVQLNTFHESNPDNAFELQEGLGLLTNFDVDINYVEDEEHLSMIIREIEDAGNPVVAIPKNSGLLIVDGEFTLLGDSFVLNHTHLDDIYRAYDSYRYDV